MARPGQLDEAAFAAHLRRLEAVGNDRVVVERIRSRAAVDLAGNAIPRHVYRLRCGHLEQVHGVPLLGGVTSLFCAEHRAYQDVVEHLTGG